MRRVWTRPSNFNYKTFAKTLERIGKPLFVALFLLVIVLSLLIKHLFSKKKTITVYKYRPKLRLPGIGIKKFAIFFIAGILLAGAAGYSYFLKIVYELPSPEELSSRKMELSTKIYDRNGNLLYNIYKDKNRSLVREGEVPLHVKLATLAAEDADFYKHGGFSVKGIARATIKYIQTRELTGGSTITQQLVKNAMLTNEKTFTRKAKEFILAIGVEHKYTKDQILTMYFNEVSYGGAAYGIKEAARYYFGKELNDLSVAEAALLAGLTKSPSKFSPFSGNPDRAKARQEHILALMRQRGFLTESQYERAVESELVYAENKIDIKAPHFVMYIRELLAEKFGEGFETLGLEVYTTLDLGIQTLAERAVSEEIDALRRQGVSNGAAFVMNPQNGEVLAMVGSRNYFDTEIDGNVNVSIQPRQPGSSIKLVNYAYALSNGLTPATIIDDAPITYKIEGQPDYVPNNYDGNYRGKITLRSALAESRNIPAVKVLASYGVNKMIEMGKKMGITTWDTPNRFGLSLTLGGGEVKLTDLAQAYQVVAKRGIKTPLSYIREIKDNEGVLVYSNSCSLDTKDCKADRVLREDVAFLLTDILKDNKARTPAFGSNSSLVIKDHPEVAVKTGTSNDLRDNLTVGYNQDFLVAVWVGNNDNTPMSRVASGLTGASPIWHNIMTGLLEGRESIAWETPDTLVERSICGEGFTRKEWFITGTEPSGNCLAKSQDSSREHLPPGQEKRQDRLN